MPCFKATWKATELGGFLGGEGVPKGYHGYPWHIGNPTWIPLIFMAFHVGRYYTLEHLGVKCELNVYSEEFVFGSVSKQFCLKGNPVADGFSS